VYHLFVPKQEATFNIGGRELRLTHLEKILYPEVGFTKGEVINYYVQIAPMVLPHLKDRPLTLKRYPNGVDGEFFYEKRAPKYRPEWLQTAPVKSDRDPTGIINYCLANDLPSLVWLGNLADLELHTFLAKRQDVEQPTQIVFDFDPGAPADVTDCAEVALWTKAWLEKLGLQSWIKSSGSKGLQLYVPLNTPVTYELTKPFAKAMALALEKAYPDRVVSDMKKTLRPGKVLVDWSQNDSSKTTVCVYSLRARPRPFVAAPLTWDEVAHCFKKDDPKHVFFDTVEVLKRVEKSGDLFAEVLTLKQKLTKQLLEKIPELHAGSSGKTAASAPKKKSAPAAMETKSGELETYKKKRDFQKTKEPAGKVKEGGEEGMFVIQKHDASHLHYDFRLAMGGVLKSWAVPKTIPYAKGEKHLAVEVEDHPLDYAGFEGIIPAGQYGGGTVMVWDTGTYRMLGGTPLGAWHEGLLHLELEGKKLKGEWTLVRTRRGDSSKNQWLLLKSGESVKALTAKEEDRSALSDRSMAEIAKAKDARWNSNRGMAAEARENGRPENSESTAEPTRKAKPGRKSNLLAKNFIEPMKCLPKKEVPDGPGWFYEIKFDGYRALSICKGGEVLILSRNNKPLTERFPSLVEALGKLGVKSAILDGEIVAMNEQNQPSFQALQNYEEGQPLAYYLFDLIELDGERLENLDLAARKKRLRTLLENISHPLRFSENLSGTPAKIWKQIKRLKLEGVIAKRADSIYEPGRRSGQWVKIKAINQQDFVIGGYTPPGGARTHFGALLVGVYEKGKLLYAGKVGTGFNQKWLETLSAQMEPLKIGECPFTNLPQPRTSRFGGGLPASEMRLCTWVEPKLICEIQFTEWTGDGSLRHPSFQGMREDISPEEVGREKAT
jgi:bifunctional non-homologous end joining protein LigD